MAKHVAVLKGGLSSEREVSLSSAKGVSEALRELGYMVTEIDVGNDVSAQLANVRPDVAFNALHGTYGEDGCIQGVLEFLKIPYTHSGVMASAIAMHKPTAKILFEAAGIKCAPGGVFSRKEVLAGDVIKRPYVIKPLNDGSSVGVLIVMKGDKISARTKNFPKSDELLVEKFIPGRELTVGVLDGKAMGVIEIRPKAGFYDYRNKYTSGMTEYLVPAPVDKKTYNKAMKIAEEAHNIIGCRGVSRTDIRLSEDDGELYVLEINTHPGMTPTSLVPKLAKHKGISFAKLVDHLVKTATLDNR